VRGLSGFKEATVRIGNEDVSVAVAHGTGNARKVLDAIRSGEKNYHMVEIMACPGGCVTGGGQPIVPASVRETLDPRALRARAIYDEDESMARRKSHENPSVRKLYEEFLGQPGGHKSHVLLHTHYQKRPQYISE
jgi:NADP-reducing hydrogenase subunit HndD